jgi:hypothetical protein
MATQTYVSAVVEGVVDEFVALRLIEEVGGMGGTVYGSKGKPFILNRLAGYNEAARFSAWLVLCDLDGDSECAPDFVANYLPQREPGMCFRIAVREVEAWLLADRESLSEFLSVSPSHIPENPEAVPDPKGEMVAIAARSKRKSVREDMVPRPESGRAVGPAYASRLSEFAVEAWRPEIAATVAPSLMSAIVCLKSLVS